MTRRVCGGCTLCCKLVPVATLGKGAGERCQHQTWGGCRVYRRLWEVAPECRLWSCAWLSDPDAGKLRRPDRARYVIDIMPDSIGAIEAGGRTIDVPVMQVWADPDHPDAWREDPALRAFMTRRAEAGQATLIRYGNARGVFVCPPPLAAEWHEQECDGAGYEGLLHRMGAAAREEREP